MRWIANRWRKNGPELAGVLTRGLPSFVLASRPGPLRGGVPVFCYHLVEPGTFEQDLAFIAANGYRTWDAERLAAYIEGRATMDEPALVLTFDDGAAHFYRVAYPLLKRYTLQAVLFIAPGLHRRAADESDRPDRPCTWEELEEMHASGLVDMQSHTWAHRSLVRWPRPLPLTGIDEASIPGRREPVLSMEEDFRLARKTLEQTLGKTVRHLALPQYQGARNAAGPARAAGYTALWGGIKPFHPLNVPHQDLFSVVRIPGDYLRRLPGAGRRTLRAILRQRVHGAADRLRARSQDTHGTSQQPQREHPAS